MAGEPSAPKPPAEQAPAPDNEGGAEVGAPLPPDAVDPELLRLSQPGLLRHPGISVAVLLLLGLLLYRLRSDIAYSLQPSAPQEAEDVQAALRAGTLRGGSYARLHGMPDYRNAAAFDAKGRRSRSALFRLLGTDSRILVVKVDDPLRTHGDSFTGRLRPLDELPYAETIRTYYQAQAQVLRALDLSAVRSQPLAQPIRDRSGQPVQLSADTELRVQVLLPDDLRVLLSKDKYPAESDAAREVSRLGLPMGPGVETRDGFGYVLRLPPAAQRQQAITQVDARGFLYQARVETYRVKVAAAEQRPEGLRLPGPAALPQPVIYQQAEGVAPPRLIPVSQPATLLPWAQIEAVQVSEPLRPPADALVLVDGEEPGGLRLWVLPLLVLLLGFAGFNLWYLREALRRGPGGAAA